MRQSSFAAARAEQVILIKVCSHSLGYLYLNPRPNPCNAQKIVQLDDRVQSRVWRSRSPWTLDPGPWTHLTHVLLAGQHQFVVDDPIRLPLEECRGGVDEHRRAVCNRLVPFLGIFPGGVCKEACTHPTCSRSVFSYHISHLSVLRGQLYMYWD